MSGRAITSAGLSRWALIWYPEGPEPRHRSAVRLPSESIGCSGRVKWPWTQIHYVQVSAGGCYSLIPYTFQMDVEARTSNSAALCGNVVDCCSLRDSMRKLVSTRSTILELLDHFHHLMTSMPSGAGGTSAGPQGGSEGGCQPKAVFVGLLDQTHFSEQGALTRALPPAPGGCDSPFGQALSQKMRPCSE